jgi:hypothetical protein
MNDDEAKSEIIWAIFPSLVEKLPSQVLAASREVIDYHVGIRLQAISRSLDMNLEELRSSTCRIAFIYVQKRLRHQKMLHIFRTDHHFSLNSWLEI